MAFIAAEDYRHHLDNYSKPAVLQIHMLAEHAANAMRRCYLVPTRRIQISSTLSMKGLQPGSKHGLHTMFQFDPFHMHENMQPARYIVANEALTHAVSPVLPRVLLLDLAARPGLRRRRQKFTVLCISLYYTMQMTP